MQLLKRAAGIENWQKTIYVLFFAQMITSVGFSSIFPFLPLYVEDLGSSTGLSIEMLAGLVFSGQAFTMMLTSPIWGALADRYGRKLMIERAMFGGAVLLFLMAFVRSAEELILLRVLQGMVTGTVAANNALAAAVTPRERTGYAMGVIQVGMGAGVAVGPLIGGAVADAFGFHAAFYITGLMLFAAGIVVWRGVEEKFEPKSRMEVSSKGILGEWRQLFSTPGVLPTYGLRFMSQLARMTILPILPLFIQTLVIGSIGLNTFVGLVIGASAATMTISSVYLGRLGDRIGHRKVLMVSVACAALLYIPQSMVKEGWQILVLQALTGVTMGGILPSISALLARYTEQGDEGAVYGMDSSITSAGRAVAPMVGGSVAAWLGLQATILTTAVLLFVTLVLAIWLLPKPKVGRKAQLAD
jgi:DHA1 family multidrug resistance protein-like MFS transporter